MFKKKPIYIAGIVLFTLVLIADLVLFFLVPTGSGRGNMPGMGGSFGGEMRSDFDAGDFDPESFRGQMPGGGKTDFGDLEGELPGGNEGFTMPEGLANMPESFDSSDIPSRGQMGSTAGSGVLSKLRSAFWPVLIVCVLGDALCIFMLVRICKKSGSDREDDQEDDDTDRPSRRDPANTCLGVIAVLLVVAVALTSLPSGKASGGVEAQVSVQQGQASRKDLASIFSGSGTLLSSDADTVEIPATVKITSYAVKNGDVVQAGDVIAKVDQASVQKAIYEVQSLIGEMDTQIAQVQGDTLDDEITSRADGRVKAIYVAQGDSVAAAMYEHGAVLLISLGGSMTVEIESTEAVSVGQSLTVTLSDETQIEGKVQQVRDGKITVTTTDDGPAPDDTVSVATEDGTQLGTGTLRVSSPMKVTGFFGTVHKIRVDVGDEVSAGDTLITLNDTEDLARYQQLLRQREELTELVRELTAMYQEGAIKAATAGIVSNVDEDAVYSPLSAASNGGYSPSGLSDSSGSGYGVVLLSNVTIEQETPSPEETVPTQTTAPTEATAPPEENTPPDGGTALPDGGTTPPADTQTDGTFAGKVTKVAYGSLQIRISETDLTGSSIAAVEAMDETLFTADRQYAPSLTVPVNLYRNGQTTPSSINAIQAGDRVLIRIEGGAVTQIDFIVGTGTGSPAPSQGTVFGGNMQAPTGGSSMGSVTSTEDEEEAVYEVEKTSVCSIIPGETMTIEISVDELDILTLAVGQEAAITLDALPGQSFAGTVKKINPTGTNEGGGTKYTVTMEVPRTGQMLDGMNASVLIEVSRLDSVLTVPAAAVYEDGNRTYVYTALDEKTGEPASAVEVTTGASDGTNIQILSGLSDGDAVYYHYADSIVIRFG